MTAEMLAREIAARAADKKADDLVVLAMGDAVSYTDFFVLATGANVRQTRAIADEIQLRLKPRRPGTRGRRA